MNKEPKKYVVDHVDPENGITYYTDGSKSVDIGPTSPSHIKWKKWREEELFPQLRKDMRKQLQSVQYGLQPDNGSFYKVELCIFTDVFPEATKLFEALLKQLREDTKLSEK